MKGEVERKPKGSCEAGRPAEPERRIAITPLAGLAYLAAKNKTPGCTRQSGAKSGYNFFVGYYLRLRGREAGIRLDRD